MREAISPSRCGSWAARTRRAGPPARAHRGRARSPATRSRSASSQNQHRIAERVEAEAVADGVLVQPARLLDTRECHHERKERRARQMKVREERVDAPEL